MAKIPKTEIFGSFLKNSGLKTNLKNYFLTGLLAIIPISLTIWILIFIIKTVEKGLLLTGTMAFGLNNATGNISKGAFGMLIEKGKVTQPVAEITISSNLGDVLNNITMIGNDLKYKSTVVAPTMLVSEMVIGGK